MAAPGYPLAGVRTTPRHSYLEVSSSNVAAHAQSCGTLAREVREMESISTQLRGSRVGVPLLCPTTLHTTQFCHPPGTAGAPKGIA